MPTVRQFRRVQSHDVNDPRQLLSYIRNLEETLIDLTTTVQNQRTFVQASDLTDSALSYIRGQLQSTGQFPLNLSGSSGRSSDFQNPLVPYLTSHPDPLNTEYSLYIYTGATPNELWAINRDVNPPVRQQIIVSGSAPANMATTDTAQNITAAKTFTVSQIFNALISTYNSIATVKNGIPAEYAFSTQSNKTTNIAFTTLYTVPTPAAYLYRVNAYLVTHTTGTAGSQVALNVRTNDGITSKTFTSANVDLTGNNYQSTVISLLCGAATLIEFSTTGTYNGPAAYDLYLLVEAL